MMIAIYASVGVVYLIGVKITFGYLLREWDGGESPTPQAALKSWYIKYDDISICLKAIFFPVILPWKLLNVFINIGFWWNDGKLTRRMAQERLRLQIKQEMAQLEKEMNK